MIFKKKRVHKWMQSIYPKCIPLVLAIFSLPGMSVTAVALTELKAAVPAHFPPEYMLGNDGLPKGFAIDTMDAIAALAGYKMVYVVKDNWADTQQALREGDVDLIPNMGITEQRKEYATFTDTVETFPVSIFVRANQFNIHNAENLAGHAVAVDRFNVGYVLMKDRNDIDLVVVTDWREGLFKLLAGQVDALIYPHPVIMNEARKMRVDDRIKVAGSPLKEIIFISPSFS